MLAEAKGALVTKDELMTAVWPHVTVEENAIQAHVASLRKILEGDAELLCTVHGYGYRLATTPAISPAGPETEPSQASMPVAVRSGWAARSIMATVLAAGVAASGLWFFRDGAPAVPVRKPAQIALLQFDLSGSGPDLGAFANDLRERISAGLSDARVLIASSENRKAQPASGSGLANAQTGAEFLLGGRIKSDGKMFDVHIQISDTDEHVAVWSNTFRKSASDRTALLAIVTTAVADAAHWAVIGRTGKVRLNAAGVAALIEARDSLAGAGRSTLALELADYRKIIAASPEFTWGHSGLAAADAFQLRQEPQNEALRTEARREANRALQLEPHNGEAYVALELVLPRFHWQEREALLLKGIAADPDFEPVAMMKGRLLWSVGRNRDALPWFKRAYNLDPLHNDGTFTYAVSLASGGQMEASQKLVEKMDAQWPEHIKTRDAHFWTSVISGAADDTLAVLADAAKWPLGMNQKSADVWRAALAAHASKDASARVRAIRAIKDTAAEGSLNRGEALLLLSVLNDVDGAFAQAQFYEPADPKWGPFLFLDRHRRCVLIADLWRWP